jgi:hypothetical protein
MKLFEELVGLVHTTFFFQITSIKEVKTGSLVTGETDQTRTRNSPTLQSLNQQ